MVFKKLAGKDIVKVIEAVAPHTDIMEDSDHLYKMYILTDAGFILSTRTTIAGL